MHEYTLSHVSDAALLRDLAALVAQERVTTATLLAHIAEVDARRLYVPAGYSSMHAYCVDELRLSEDAAFRRIRAARAARQFPALFVALAEGRLHLAAVSLIAPHLTTENAGDLIEAATHRRKAEIEEMLLPRFPAPDMPAMVRLVPAASPRCASRLVPGRVGGESSNGLGVCGSLLAGLGNGAVTPDLDALVPGRVENGRPGPAPQAPERFLLKLTMNKSTHDKLRYAQALLSHAIPNGDVAQVLERALDALIVQLEKRKLGSAARRRSRRCTSTRKRLIPAHVRRAVWERDQGQCTFVSARGHRCSSRHFLEFDHVDPVARGGTATVDGIRLRCRAHNQYEAERVFGAKFMAQKRQEARLAAEARARHAEADERVQAEARDQFQDVVAGLRGLGCRGDEARRAAEFAGTLHCNTLEERMRAALQFIGRRVFQARATTHS